MISFVFQVNAYTSALLETGNSLATLTYRDEIGAKCDDIRGDYNQVKMQNRESPAQGQIHFGLEQLMGMLLWYVMNAKMNFSIL